MRPAGGAAGRRGGRLGRWALLALCSVACSGSDRVVVQGRILESDGTTLPHAFAGTAMTGRLTAPTPVADGRFRLVLPGPGEYFLWLGGAAHRTIRLPLLAQTSAVIDLDVRLAPTDWREGVDQVTAVVYDEAFEAVGHHPLRRDPDGRLSATFPATGERVLYQLTGIERPGPDTDDRPSEPPGADTYLFNRKGILVDERAGAFVAAAPVHAGRATICLDPGRLRRGDLEPAVRFGTPDDRAAGIVRLSRAIAAIERRLDEESRAADGDRRISEAARSRARAALDSLGASEPDPTLERFVLLSSLRFGSTDGDRATAERLLREIPPASPLWALLWPDPYEVFGRITMSLAQTEAPYLYGDRFLVESRDRRARAAVLGAMVEVAFMTGRSDRGSRDARLLTTDYSDTAYADWARKEHDPGRAIQPGRLIPDFTVPSLDDPKVTLSRASIRGHRVLIEFWASWCAPCVEGMEELHRLHARFRSKNFTILTLSADRTRQEALDFREKRWPMPWLNGFLSGGEEGQTWRDFEVIGIPRFILVDEHGVILATDLEMAGGLEASVARYLEATDLPGAARGTHDDRRGRGGRAAAIVPLSSPVPAGRASACSG